MKIPLNWLKSLVALPTSEKDLTDKLTMVGHLLDKKEVINDQTVIDLELRGNRADCYSILGIAREVSAIYGSKVKKLQEINLNKGKISVNLNIKTPLVKRVGMIEIKNVIIAKSPKWLKERLESYGIESVNNIVDLTNYVMIEMGEPMHAFDLDKIGKNLEIRLAREGEKITTFMGESLTLTNEDLVWAKDGQILSVAGAVGEKYNSISNTTKNILLEAANYDRSNIRRTVYRHKLLTDAGIRHEKELDPEMVSIAIGRFLYLIYKNKWGEFKPVFYDYYPNPVKPKVINFDLKQLESLGGVKIEKKEVIRILTRLSFEVDRSMRVKVPTYRTDVALPEDIIEEVLRIYGYDKIPTHTLSLEIPKNITPNYIDQEEHLKNAAISAGFDEIVSLSFIKQKFLDLNIHPESLGKRAVSLINPPSPDNENLRITLLPNLYEHAKKAIDEREADVRLFELGKIYFKLGDGYKEERKIGFIYFKNDSFSKFKSCIEGFLQKADLPKVDFINEPTNLPLINSYRLELHKNIVGFGGEIGRNIYYLELDLDRLLDKEVKYKISLWPKYPPQIEDLTLTFPPKTHIGEVIKLIPNSELVDIYKDSYTFRIWYRDMEKTLTDEEVKKIRKGILDKIKSKFGGTVKN